MASLSHFPALDALEPWSGVIGCIDVTKTRSEELSERFTEQWHRCRDWLLPFMQNNQPKFLMKDELRAAAMRELNVSKNAFDAAWVIAIEDTGRLDWYEPLRKRLRVKS